MPAMSTAEFSAELLIESLISDVVARHAKSLRETLAAKRRGCVALRGGLEARLVALWQDWADPHSGLAVQIVEVCAREYPRSGKKESEKARTHCEQTLSGELAEEMAYLRERQAEAPEELDSAWLDDVAKRLEVARQEAMNAAERRIAQAALRTQTQSEPVAPKRKRRGRRSGTPKKLTARQTEVIHLYGIHKGNVAAVARAMGLAPKTVRGHRDAAYTKLGQKAPRFTQKRQKLPEDRKGQTILSSG